MKKKWKQMLAGMLAMLTLFVTIFSGLGEVKAASSASNLKLWYASVKEHGVITEFNSYTYTANIMYAMIDGSTAYCMNYAKSCDGGQKMSSSSQPKTALSAAQEKQLSYCMYYGFGTNTEGAPNNTQKNQYIATQAMVWIIEKNLFGTAKADSAAQKLCACAPNATEAYSYYENLRNKIQASYNVTVPSFASTTQSSAPTHELKWNEANQRFEITLNDTKGALSNFNFTINGYHLSKNGNQLTIYTDQVNTSATIAKAVEGTGLVEPKTNCVYWQIDKDKYQEFISTRPQADPVSAYFKVKTESIGYGRVIKSDALSGVKLKGAEYGIYSDSSCTRLVSTMTTGADGTAVSKELVAGTYYIKEQKAPMGYVISETVHTIMIRPGQTTELEAVNKEQMGALSIYKEGEVLVGWDNRQFIYEIQRLQGASFRVTAGEDIYQSDGTKVYSKDEVIAEEITTGADGLAVLTDLHLGTYVVTETKSVPGYTIYSKPQRVEILYKDQTVSVQYEALTIQNARQRAEVSVTKKDAETENPLFGGEYTMYAGNDIVNYAGDIIVSKDAVLQTVSTDATGKAQFTIDLPIENGFYVKETKAPYGYARNNEDVYTFSFCYLKEKETTATFQSVFENERTTAKINLQKVDAESQTAVPQGDASLKGALYGLYAREDIMHPDGTKVLFQAGDLVCTMRTDAEGKAEVRNLYLGRYYVKEISASEGYTLDETEHEIDCNYEGDHVLEVSRGTVSREQVKKQPFQLIKISDDGMNTEGTLLKGAGFTAYLKSDLVTKADGSYDYETSTPVELGVNGEKELFTDETGYIRTRPLPYGTYVVVETTTPHNMKSIKPFEVQITEHNPNEPQVWRVFLDRAFTAKLRIVKKDGDTGQRVLLPNAEFKIYDMEKKEYVSMITTYPSKVTHTSFFTDATGELILPNALGVGRYRIEEVSAPYGYVLNKAYREIVIDTDTAYEIDPDTNDAIITVEYVNMPAVGKLVIEKYGETKAEKLQGAVFEIYAAEDIYTADMQKDTDGNRVTYYKKGELVRTVETGEDGLAVVSDLPLGTYEVVEIKAPEGYVASDEKLLVRLEYVNGETPVTESRVCIHNQKQNPAIESPKTGDGAAYVVWVSMAALAGVCMVWILCRKKSKK